MAAPWAEPNADTPEARVAACKRLRDEGTVLFKAGDYVGATRAYKDALRHASTAQAECESCGQKAAPNQSERARYLSGAAAAAEQRARVLCNLASCHLRLSPPLDALDAAAEAMAVCSRRDAPVWKRELRTGLGWSSWTREAYCRAILRRTQAAQAAGVPLLALPDVHWAMQDAVKAPALDAGLVRELTARAMALARVQDVCPTADVHETCVVRGSWTRVVTRLNTPAPAPRRGGASAVVAGWLYIFGGALKETCDLYAKYSQRAHVSAGTNGYPTSGEDEDELERLFNLDDGTAGDCWRISAAAVLAAAADPAAPRPAWQQLLTPALSDGPPASEHARAAACDALNLFVVLAGGRLYTLSVSGPADEPVSSWRFLGCPWRRGRDAPRCTMDADCELAELQATLCVGGEFAYVFWAAEGLRAQCLRTGAPSIRIDTAGGAPARSSVYMWVARAPPPGGDAADVILRLWGGISPGDGSGPPQVPGLAVTDRAANADMWTCDRGAWQQMWPPVKGGGGVPPLTRGEALCLPRPGGAVLLAGYSESLPRLVSTGGAQPINLAYRYLNDAFVFAEDHGGGETDADDDGHQRRGWRAVATPRAGRPPPLAQCLGGWYAPGGAALLAGGYTTQPEGCVVDPSGSPHKYPLTALYVLRLNGGNACDAMSPRACAQCGATGCQLRACSRCRRARYCGAACQRAHWPAHKRECERAAAA